MSKNSSEMENLDDTNGMYIAQAALGRRRRKQTHVPLDLNKGQFGKVPSLNQKPSKPSEPLPHIDHDYHQNDPQNPHIIIHELREKIKKLKVEGLKKDRRIRNLRSLVQSMKNGKLPKYTEEIVCKKRLKRKYCEAQIDDMISEKLDQEAENGRQNIMMMHSNWCAM